MSNKNLILARQLENTYLNNRNNYNKLRNKEISLDINFEIVDTIIKINFDFNNEIHNFNYNLLHFTCYNHETKEFNKEGYIDNYVLYYLKSIDVAYAERSNCLYKKYIDTIVINKPINQLKFVYNLENINQHKDLLLNNKLFISSSTDENKRIIFIDKNNIINELFINDYNSKLINKLKELGINDDNILIKNLHDFDNLWIYLTYEDKHKELNDTIEMFEYMYNVNLIKLSRELDSIDYYNNDDKFIENSIYINKLTSELYITNNVLTNIDSTIVTKLEDNIKSCIKTLLIMEFQENIVDSLINEYSLTTNVHYDILEDIPKL